MLIWLTAFVYSLFLHWRVSSAVCNCTFSGWRSYIS